MASQSRTRHWQLRRLPYANAHLLAGPDGEALILELSGQFRLALRAWPERDSTPFDSTELERFENPRALGTSRSPLDQIPIGRSQLRSIRQTCYDRTHGRHGAIRVRAALLDRDARRHLVELVGPDTNSMAALRSLMPSLPALRAAGAGLQISIANQGDIEGNFCLLPQSASQWKFFAPCDEPWRGQLYRGLVETIAGERFPADVRLTGDARASSITRVEVRRLGSSEASWEELEPARTELVLVTQTLLWDSLRGLAAIRGHYGPRSDLRHLLRFPFTDRGILFYDALLRTPEGLERALTGDLLEFRLDDECESTDDDLLAARLTTVYGYAKRPSAAQVVQAGDFCIAERRIWIRFLTARYPINALAVSHDGTRVAFLAVLGMSGQIGAEYASFADWACGNLDWQPAALFVLDNGLDPTWIALDGGAEIALLRGRENAAVALNVIDLASC